MKSPLLKRALAIALIALCAAAKRYGTRGLGVDLDPPLIDVWSAQRQ